MPLINHTREKRVYERRSKNCHVPGKGVKDVVESVGYNKFDNSSMHYIDRQRKIGWLPRDWNTKNWVKFSCIFGDRLFSMIISMIIVFIIFIISLNSSEFISILAVLNIVKKKREVGSLVGILQNLSSKFKVKIRLNFSQHH